MQQLENANTHFHENKRTKLKCHACCANFFLNTENSAPARKCNSSDILAAFGQNKAIIDTNFRAISFLIEAGKIAVFLVAGRSNQIALRSGFQSHLK